MISRGMSWNDQVNNQISRKSIVCKPVTLFKQRGSLVVLWFSIFVAWVLTQNFCGKSLAPSVV